MDSHDNEAMMKQAQNIWTMLDDMAANNPEAYKKFIDKQIKEGKSVMAPPTPHMAVKTKIIEPIKEDLYINFCGWSRVPEPKNTDEPVSVTGVSIDKMDDQAGNYQLTSLAFNPKVLENYGRDSSNHVDRDTLVQLAFDYVESQHKVKLSRRYTILSKEIPHKGCLKHIQKSFTSRSKTDKQFEAQIEQLQKNFAPVSGQNDKLLDQLASIVISNNPSEKESSKSDLADLKMPFDGQNKGKTNLIQEISNKRKPPTTPKYSMNTVKSDSNINQLLVKITLTGVTSVQECDLQISSDDISLEVSDLYKLHLDLPQPCDEEAATAKFNKKVEVLTVTLPFK